MSDLPQTQPANRKIIAASPHLMYKKHGAYNATAGTHDRLRECDAVPVMSKNDTQFCLGDSAPVYVWASKNSEVYIRVIYALPLAVHVQIPLLIKTGDLIGITLLITSSAADHVTLW